MAANATTTAKNATTKITHPCDYLPGKVCILNDVCPYMGLPDDLCVPHCQGWCDVLGTCPRRHVTGATLGRFRVLPDSIKESSRYWEALQCAQSGTMMCALVELHIKAAAEAKVAAEARVIFTFISRIHMLSGRHQVHTIFRGSRRASVP